MQSLSLFYFAALVASASAQCLSIAELVCRVSSLSTLCALITQAGLQSALSDRNLTLFAPTNTAFFTIGDRLAEIYNNTNELTDLILFHAVDGILYTADLICGGSIQMVNGQISTTECQDDNTYQVGEGNSADAMPQIVSQPLNVCNGNIFIVDAVLLPTSFEPVPQVETESDCKTIAEFVCDSSLLSTLCTLFSQVGLDRVLTEGSWLLFAPTNEAFTNLGDDTLGAIAADTELLSNILSYHLSVGEILSVNDLECNGSLKMTSGTNTTTVCDGDTIYQTGDANEQGSEPEIIIPDILTCNGRISVISQVLLPSLDVLPVPSEPPQQQQQEEEEITQEEECQPIGDLVCATDNLTTFCTILTDSGFLSTLNKHSWTVFAPTNEAFANLAVILEDLTTSAGGGANHLVQEILLHHLVTQHVIYSTDFECNRNLRMADGKKTRTLCVDESSFIQVGKGNDWNSLPQIVSFNRQACNGVLHTVDHLILPEVI